MWSFIKRVSTLSQETTLKGNVTSFWEWFASNSERFHDTIENKKCSDLTDEVSAAFDRWLPGMAWVFGPGEERSGHSLTISGEGVQLPQIVAKYCVDRAPALKNWTFYSFRQPAGEVGAFSINMGNETFKVSDLWVSTFLDEQSEKIDIKAWHPLFQKMQANEAMRILFLLLDEVLGEFGTGNWIGEIKIGDDRLQDAMPIHELKDYVAHLESEREWKKYSPVDTYCSWKAEATSGFPRADIFAGTSRCFQLVAEYGQKKGPIKNPLAGLGVDLVFVCIPRSWLPRGKEVDRRYHVEDAIAGQLTTGHAGITLGGATGNEQAYIDLMLVDGQRSLELVRSVLREQGLPKSTEIRWFTEHKVMRL